MKLILIIFFSRFYWKSYAYDDLSNGKASSQILMLPHPPNNDTWFIANNAVDRNPSTCTGNHAIGGTSVYTNVWWRVDLGDIYSIHSIRILFKDYGPDTVMRQRGRFAGFSIYLSNTTNKEDWVLCYKDGPELPPLDFNTTCMKYGRYVIYYNERLKGITYSETITYTALCEVIVHGCSTQGAYGVNCDQACPKNCRDHRCHIRYGSCQCKPGYTGHFCDTECPNRSFGLECKNKCVGHCKNDSPCHHEFGNCTEGCALGWMTTNCAKECEDGNFGPGCIHKCSGNCRDKSQCNKATGVCDFGCNPGYTEPFCNTTCADGKFGIQCKEACSGHCLNHSKCNHIEGSCNKGCENGYTGDRCNNPCEDGLFGVNCSQKCSLNCQQSQKCNNRDGSCPCSSGWTGQHCNKECDAGFYGENCVQACSSHCRNMTCAKDNGKCLDGCEPSYYGVKCDQEGDTCTVVSYAKEYHIMGSILGVYTVITCVIFALCILRRHRKTKEIVSKQIEEKDKEKSYETMQIDRVLYQELGSFENKGIYQELHVEGNAYQNLDLITNF